MSDPLRVVLRPERDVMAEHWVEAELRMAGIPLDSGSGLSCGTLQRFVDPEDGATIWEWRP